MWNQSCPWARACAIAVMVGAAGLVACETRAEKGTSAPVKTAATVPDSVFLASAPEGARQVQDAKPSAKVGETITIRGRIGGSHEPFVPGRAVFTLVGDGPKACSDIPGDACKTPWDYCCEETKQITAHSATVQIVDGAGNPLRAEVKGTKGIKELSELVVVGTVASADGAALIVNATGIFVAKP